MFNVKFKISSKLQLQLKTTIANRDVSFFSFHFLISIYSVYLLYVLQNCFCRVQSKMSTFLMLTLNQLQCIKLNEKKWQEIRLNMSKFKCKRLKNKIYHKRTENRIKNRIHSNFRQRTKNIKFKMKVKRNWC